MNPPNSCSISAANACGVRPVGAGPLWGPLAEVRTGLQPHCRGRVRSLSRPSPPGLDGRGLPISPTGKCRYRLASAKRSHNELRVSAARSRRRSSVGRTPALESVWPAMEISTETSGVPAGHWWLIEAAGTLTERERRYSAPTWRSTVWFRTAMMTGEAPLMSSVS